MALSDGQQEIQDLMDAGFSSQEIQAWRQNTTAELTQAGFSGQEIGEYFGEKNPDMSGLKATIETNLKTYQETKTALPKDGLPLQPHEAQMHEADGFMEALGAGFQMSVTGLVVNGKPTTILPENAPMYMRIANQVGMVIGDVPAMAAGSIAGGGPASPITAGAAAFALPTALRETLMDGYEKGDFQDFNDFWERASGVFLNTAKSYVTGAATVGAAGIAGKTLAPLAAPGIAKSIGVTSAEIATMTTVGAALEGHAPRAQDFVDAAIVVGGLKAAGTVAGKVRKVYSKTGVKPSEVFEASQTDPTIKQELVASNIEIPKAFGGDKLENAKFTYLEPGQMSMVVEGSTPNRLRVEPIVSKVEPVTETPSQPTELTPIKQSEKAVLERIGAPTDKPKQPVKFDDVYKDWVDAKDPLKVLVAASKGEVEIGKDPYILSRLFVDHGNKTKSWLEFGPSDFKSLKPVEGVKPLQAIVAPFTKEGAKLDSFKAYIVSKRALEIEAQGKKSGFPIADAEAVVKSGKAEFESAAKEIVKFQNEATRYLKDSGFLTEEGYQKMISQNQDYIPFTRVIDEMDGVKSVRKSGGGNPLKRLKGSEAQIVDPIESVARNTGLYIKRAEQNRAAVAFVEHAEKNGYMGSEIIERVKTPMDKIEVKADELSKFFREQGIEPDVETVAIFRPKSLNLGENDVPVFRNGKMEVYRMKPEIADIYKKMDGGPAANIFIKAMRPFASLQRATIAITPDFVIRNGIRDATTAAVFSKYPHVPVYDSLVAMGDIIGKREPYQAWLRSGGGNGSFLEIDSKYIDNNIYKMNTETGLLNSAINVVRSPLEMIHVVSNLVENSTRVGAFKNAVKGKNYADLSFNEMAEAGMQSREITVDFARMGAKTQAINQITAYWNVGVQGMDRTARAFQADPLGTSAKAMAYVTLPSVMLWWANHDDPRWKEIPNWQKDAFWIVMTKDTIFRVPKPMELGLLFGSLPERTLEKYFSDNPKAFDEFNDTMTKTFTQFAPIPTIMSPALEHWAEKSFFTGNPIIPSKFENIFPQYQFNEHTTESAKILSQFIGAMPGMKDNSIGSPFVIENYVRAWSGNTGMYALKTMDSILTKSGVVAKAPEPTSTLADMPFIKSFVVRYPSANTQSIVDFEKRYGEQMKAISTIKYLAKQGDFQNMQKEFKLAAEENNITKLRGLSDALSNMNRMVQMINRDPNMKPDEKRQFIDSLYSKMIEAAQMGNKLQEDLDKQLGSK